MHADKTILSVAFLFVFWVGKVNFPTFHERGFTHLLPTQADLAVWKTSQSGCCILLKIWMCWAFWRTTKTTECTQCYCANKRSIQLLFLFPPTSTSLFLPQICRSLDSFSFFCEPFFLRPKRWLLFCENCGRTAVFQSVRAVHERHQKLCRVQSIDRGSVFFFFFFFFFKRRPAWKC